MQGESETTPAAIETQPDYEQGIIILNVWTVMISDFLDICNTDSKIKKAFKIIFANKAEHFFSKYQGRDFAHFFLNIDIKSRLLLLNYISGNAVDLSLPDIPNWEELGQEVGLDKIAPFTQEVVRRYAPIIKRLSVWECYPQRFLWLNFFALYANTTAIEDNGYKGKKYGNFENWAQYWGSCTSDRKRELIQLIVINSKFLA